MNWPVAIVAALAGYFLGSISFARLVASRVLPSAEIGTTEFPLPRSEKKFRLRSFSATSISSRAGPKYGCLTSLLDMAKAFVPVLVVRVLYPDQAYHLIAGGAAVLGHVFPIYHRFQGGRGQSPIMGALLAVDWLSLPPCLLAGSLLGLGLLRDPLAGYTGWVFLLVPWFWWRFDDWSYTAFAAALALITAVAFRSEYLQDLRLRLSGDYRPEDLLPMLQGTDMGRPLKYMRRWPYFRKRLMSSEQRAENE